MVRARVNRTVARSPSLGTLAHAFFTLSMARAVAWARIDRAIGTCPALVTGTNTSDTGTISGAVVGTCVIPTTLSLPTGVTETDSSAINIAASASSITLLGTKRRVAVKAHRKLIALADSGNACTGTAAMIRASVNRAVYLLALRASPSKVTIANPAIALPVTGAVVRTSVSCAGCTNPSFVADALSSLHITLSVIIASIGT